MQETEQITLLTTVAVKVSFLVSQRREISGKVPFFWFHFRLWNPVGTVSGSTSLHWYLPGIKNEIVWVLSGSSFKEFNTTVLLSFLLRNPPAASTCLRLNMFKLKRLITLTISLVIMIWFSQWEGSGSGVSVVYDKQWWEGWAVRQLILKEV